MERITHKMREEYWFALIKQCNDECAEKNIKKITWMEEHNICSKRFYYWQKKLRAQAAFEIVCHQADNPLPVQTPEVQFSPLPNIVQSTSGAARIQLGTATIELDDNISDSLLLRIVKAVSHV